MVHNLMCSTLYIVCISKMKFKCMFYIIFLHLVYVFSLRKQFENVSIDREGLPPAPKNGRQLVTSDQWTIYRPEGGKFQVQQKDGNIRQRQSWSLPNSSQEKEGIEITLKPCF